MAFFVEGAIALAWLAFGFCLAVLLWALGEVAGVLLTWALGVGPLGALLAGLILYVSLKALFPRCRKLFVWLNRPDE